MKVFPTVVGEPDGLTVFGAVTVTVCARAATEQARGRTAPIRKRRGRNMGKPFKRKGRPSTTGTPFYYCIGADVSVGR